jgi:hypothetical protein
VTHDRKPKGGVFIASDALLTAWRERTTSTDDMIGISDTAELDLFAVIARHQPQVVVLEEAFACTERGATLIGRLQTTPEFENIDIRVLWSDRATAAREQLTTTPLTTLATSIRPSYPSVRRVAPRRALAVNAALDGRPVQVIDLSVGGAQVLSAVPLHPEQRVDLLLADSIRITARVVWATLQIQPSPLYRAGLEFLTVDAEALQRLIQAD